MASLLVKFISIKWRTVPQILLIEFYLHYLEFYNYSVVMSGERIQYKEYIYILCYSLNHLLTPQI